MTIQNCETQVRFYDSIVGLSSCMCLEVSLSDVYIQSLFLLMFVLISRGSESQGSSLSGQSSDK